MPVWKIGRGYQRVRRLRATGCDPHAECPVEAGWLSVLAKVQSAALQNQSLLIYKFHSCHLDLHLTHAALIYVFVFEPNPEVKQSNDLKDFIFKCV